MLLHAEKDAKTLGYRLISWSVLLILKCGWGQGGLGGGVDNSCTCFSTV